MYLRQLKILNSMTPNTIWLSLAISGTTATLHMKYSYVLHIVGPTWHSPTLSPISKSTSTSTHSPTEPSWAAEVPRMSISSMSTRFVIVTTNARIRCEYGYHDKDPWREWEWKPVIYECGSQWHGVCGCFFADDRTDSSINILTVPLKGGWWRSACFWSV